MRPGQGQRRNRRNGSGHSGGHNGGHNGDRRPSQHQPQGQARSAAALRNQIFDSNGPDMRVRGNAFQVFEKYQALAKDALSSGDRVLAENYLQHAEHYYRIIEAINEATAAEQRARQSAYGAEQQQPMSPGSGFYGQPGGDGMNAQQSSQAQHYQGQGQQQGQYASARQAPVQQQGPITQTSEGFFEGDDEEENGNVMQQEPIAAGGRR